jgi:hypothetical protein
MIRALGIGKATKGARWMPRHREAKKDVDSCEKLRGAANKRRSVDIRIGQPGWDNQSAYTEYIGVMRPTGRTETSKYPQEKKSKEILLVAASERGIAQTNQACLVGVVGPLIWE